MSTTNDPESARGRAPEDPSGGEPETSSDDGLELRPTADGSLTLYDPAVGQTYHSDRGAIAEARYVYLGASGAARRLAHGEALRVLEVGLGTGLNLLLTLDAARSGAARLHYRALERRPPPAEQVRSMDLARFLDHPELVSAWLEVVSDLRERVAPHETGPGRSDLALASYELPGGAVLEVALGTAAGPSGRPAGAAAAALASGWADVIYHDAFSPAASPELWSEAFLRACASALTPGGVWVSYTVAGAVRRRLTAAGLEPVKLAGPPGGKREMCRAVKSRGSGSDPTAWPTR